MSRRRFEQLDAQYQTTLMQLSQDVAMATDVRDIETPLYLHRIMGAMVLTRIDMGSFGYFKSIPMMQEAENVIHGMRRIAENEATLAMPPEMLRAVYKALIVGLPPTVMPQELIDAPDKT